jgi:hypothetical protein
MAKIYSRKTGLISQPNFYFQQSQLICFKKHIMNQDKDRATVQSNQGANKPEWQVPALQKLDIDRTLGGIGAGSEDSNTRSNNALC